jgi:hypothetical protein
MDMNKLGKLYFFARKTFWDIVAPHRFYVSEGYGQRDDWPYALDYTAKNMADYYDMVFDENGIIMMPHYIDHVESSRGEGTHYYSPLKIAHYVLGTYNDYLASGDESLLPSLFHHVNYLVQYSEQFEGDENVLVWRTPTSVARYGVGVNHTSAIVQGLVISALLRAYLLTDERQYLDVAQKALPILEIPVERGGVRAESHWGVAYEEYPSFPYSHVVNGFIFCLIGLYELNKISGLQHTGFLLNQGINTLKKMIPYWVTDTWTKYDLRDVTNGERVNLSTRHYQYLHIDQVDVMYRVTGDRAFEMARVVMEGQVRRIHNNVRPYISKFRKLL